MYWIYKQTNYYPIFHLISGSHWVLLLGHFHRRDEPQDLGPRVCPSPRQLLEKHVEHHGLCGRCDRVGAVLLFNNIDLIICLKKLTTFNEQYLLVNENVFAKLVVTSVTRWQHYFNSMGVYIIENVHSCIKITKVGTKVCQITNQNNT